MNSLEGDRMVSLHVYSIRSAVLVLPLIVHFFCIQRKSRNNGMLIAPISLFQIKNHCTNIPPRKLVAAKNWTAPSSRTATREQSLWATESPGSIWQPRRATAKSNGSAPSKGTESKFSQASTLYDFLTLFYCSKRIWNSYRLLGFHFFNIERNSF